MKKNREGFLESETIRECTNCNVLFNKTSKTVTLCSRCNSNRVKCMSPESKMYTRAKNRATIKGIEFSLKREEILIPKTCPVLDIPLYTFSGKSGGKKNSPALDRINPLRGYTSDNVQVISHLANMMKSHASPNELITFAKWVLKTYNTGEDNDLSLTQRVS